MPKLKVPKPNVPLKNINWTKIPNNKITNTIFADVIKQEVDLDFQELEELFSKKVIEKKVAVAAKKPATVHIVDPKRSQNIGVRQQVVRN